MLLTKGHILDLPLLDGILCDRLPNRLLQLTADFFGFNVFWFAAGLGLSVLFGKTPAAIELWSLDGEPSARIEDFGLHVIKLGEKFTSLLSVWSLLKVTIACILG
jgi:hypothetical protein